jgi:hypothetical protein
MPPDAAIVHAADYSARHWLWLKPGPLRPGTEAHKHATSAMFQATFNPYKPSIIEWPKLDAAAHARLLSLPIWDIAVQTEGKAGLRMKSYAATVADPEMRAALELNAWEEGRHKDVLSHLVAAYGIALAPEPSYIAPRDAEWAYLVTGFSECIDSFFAFGLFELARRSGFFPPELVETFEPVMQEECRHILLFANWLAWHRRTMHWWQRPWFELRVAAVWAFLVWERIRLAKGIGGESETGGQDNNFTISGAQAVGDGGVDTALLMDLCLAENERRFAGYDGRLLRPTTVPRLVRLVRRFMHWSERMRARLRSGSQR